MSGDFYFCLWVNDIFPHTYDFAVKWALITVISPGNTRPQSSQLAELQWTDPGVKSEICVLGLISTLQKKSPGGERIVEHYPQILEREEKATTTTTTITVIRKLI